MAGLIAASVVLPKAMAYATVAGLPVGVGLATAFVPAVVYALLGSSRILSVSSTTTIAILAGAELSAAVPDGDPVRLAAATATLTALVGLALLVARLARLGTVANFISMPVLTGFKAGIGLVIVFDQLPKLLGISVGHGSNPVEAAEALLKALATVSGPTVLVGLGTMALLVAAERVRPHSPVPLVAVGGAVVLSWWLGLADRGVAVVGAIPQGLPSLTLPDPGLVRALLPGALGIALMSFTETIAAGRAFQAPRDPPIRPNRELVAVGLANLAGAFSGAMPAGGGTTQTSVVRSAGGRSPVALLVCAAAAVATMLVLAPWLGFLPQATLAAVVIVYSVGLIQPADFTTILRVRRMEFVWAVAAAAGVLVFGTLQGIVVAIVLSLITLALQTTDPRVSVIGRKRGADVLRPVSAEHPEDETFEGLLIVRPEGLLFFVNAQAVADHVTSLVQEYRPRVLALDMSRVPNIEYSALQMIKAGAAQAREQGIAFWLLDLNPDVLAVVRRDGFDRELGPDLMFNTRAAIARYTKSGPAPAGSDEAPT
ncbi:SulP family inorganic anion transporter [Alsobacter sp. R-9]